VEVMPAPDLLHLLLAEPRDWIDNLFLLREYQSISRPLLLEDLFMEDEVPLMRINSLYRSIASLGDDHIVIRPDMCNQRHLDGLQLVRTQLRRTGLYALGFGRLFESR
jgi:hypothetical protein